MLNRTRIEQKVTKTQNLKRNTPWNNGKWRSYQPSMEECLWCTKWINSVVLWNSSVVLNPLNHARTLYRVLNPLSHVRILYRVLNPLSHARILYRVLNPLSHARILYRVLNPLSHARILYRELNPLSHARILYTVLNPLSHARRKSYIMTYTNNKGADQLARSCCLISTLVVHCLHYAIPKLAKWEISKVCLVLNLTW